MTEPGVLPDVIERFLDEPVAPPDVAALRVAGRVAARRRRLGLGASAAVLLIVGGGLAAALTYDGDRLERTPDPTSESTAMTDPPPGTRWVGIGRVVIAVPADWSDGETWCNQPTADTVYFPTDASRSCKIVGPYSSLAISDHPFDGPTVAEATPDGQVGGHDVEVTGHNCAEPNPMTCSLDIAVPALEAYFRLTLHGANVYEDLEAMRGTITVLPDDQVAMPDVPLLVSRRSQYAETIVALELAGLEPVVQDYGCMRSIVCADRTGVEPPPGHVVPVGTRITVTVRGAAASEPPAELCPSCD